MARLPAALARFALHGLDVTALLHRLAALLVLALVLLQRADARVRPLGTLPPLRSFEARRAALRPADPHHPPAPIDLAGGLARGCVRLDDGSLRCWQAICDPPASPGEPIGRPPWTNWPEWTELVLCAQASGARQEARSARGNRLDVL